MRKYVLRIILYSILTIFISGFFFLLFVLVSLLPIVRKYTIHNKTNEIVYVTPLMEFGNGVFNSEDIFTKIYIENTSNLTVLSQFMNYSPPAIPSLRNFDIKIKPNGNKVLFIDYEQLKQEAGPELLLIKRKN